MRKTFWLAVLGALALIVGFSTPTNAARPGSSYPTSIASTGDSITRAFDASGSCFLSDCPQYSWSTGSSTAVNSHYQRLVKLNRKVQGNAHNNAVTGATMYDLNGQLQTTAAQNVGYVTVLMGANDLCTSSASTMTSTATFTSQFDTALGGYVAARPTSKVFISSIPNIYQLWAVLHNNASAQATWGLFGICQSMLSGSNTEADRQLVVQREAELNAALATVCAKYTSCRFDSYAGFNTTFTASDVSTVDYFHPSLQGLNKIATVTWAASFWG
jgi:hypothetical protein